MFYKGESSEERNRPHPWILFWLDMGSLHVVFSVAIDGVKHDNNPAIKYSLRGTKSEQQVLQTVKFPPIQFVLSHHYTAIPKYYILYPYCRLNDKIQCNQIQLWTCNLSSIWIKNNLSQLRWRWTQLLYACSQI